MITPKDIEEKVSILKSRGWNIDEMQNNEAIPLIVQEFIDDIEKKHNIKPPGYPYIARDGGYYCFACGDSKY